MDPRPRLRSILHRLRTALPRDRRERELDEEIRFHLEKAVEAHRARGLDEEEARQAALRGFGGVEQALEACRDERGLPGLEATARDLSWATRTLRKSPAFTATVVVVLALAIGATTAIFSVVHDVLLEPLPLPEPDRLVALWESNAERGWEHQSTTPLNLLDWRERATSFTGISGHGWVGGWALSGDGGAARAERVSGVEVMGDFFSVLGVEPAFGPGLTADDHWAEGERRVMISHGLWHRRFGGDPAVVGRRIELNGVPYTVAGVAPAGFTYPGEDLDVWVPFVWYRSFLTQPWFRFAHFVRPVGRLAPGVSHQAAHREIAAIAARLGEELPETNAGYGAGLTPLKEWTVGDTARPLLVLFAAVALVLLVASANVAGLLLARSSARVQELTLRSALGASRGRIARQLLSESLLLAACGGIAGVALGIAGTRLLARHAAAVLPRAGEIGVDGAGLAFAAGLTLATGLLFGIAPALGLARTPSAEALKGAASRTAGSRRQSRSRQALVLAEVALAVVLVAGAGLTLRSFASLVRVDPGFDPEGLVTASFDLPNATYPEDEQAVAFGRRLLDPVQRLPGVEAAALASSLPLQGSVWTADFIVEGRPPGEHGVDFQRRIVSPGYFRTMGVPLLRGRPFLPSDDERGRPVVVINQEVARLHFPGQDPIGQRIAFAREPDAESIWREVVGVVGDEKIEGLAAPGRMEIFVPHGQELYGDPGLAWRNPKLVVRAATGEPASLVPAVREVLRELDPDLPLYDVRTLEEMVADGAARERLLVLLLGLFAAVALVLSTVGLYGLVAYAVAQRRREIGIRLALGATAREVVGRIVGRSMVLVAGGLALGLAAALALSRTLESLLYEIRPTDPPTLAATAALLAAAALAATWLPAQRATAVDPLETLRVE